MTALSLMPYRTAISATVSTYQYRRMNTIRFSGVRVRRKAFRTFPSSLASSSVSRLVSGIQDSISCVRQTTSAFRFAEDLHADLTQTAVLGVINECIDPDDVVIGASGSLPGDMQRMWRPRGVDTYHMEYGYSCMGYEVSGALGVKHAIGDRDVYAMAGDGSFIMLHSELLTALQEHKKINVCLFNNASFGCINNLQVGHGNDTLCTELRFRGEDGAFSGPFMPVDFAKIAEAYGCKGYTVHTLDELRAVVEPETARDLARWGKSSTLFITQMANLRDFVSGRAEVVKNGAIAFFGVSAEEAAKYFA